MSKEITDLEIIANDLEKKIERLKIEESNLKSSIHTEGMRLESQKKLDEIHLVQKENNGSMKLDLKESKIFDREKVVANSEEALKDRIFMIEKREQQYVYLEDQIKQLNKERKDFEAMRRSQMVELDKIKEEKEVFLAKEKMLEGKEDGLRGREKAVVQKEKFIQDEVGRLTEWEKQIKIKIEHLEGLKKELSYAG